jgi:hypothetical protein
MNQHEEARSFQQLDDGETFKGPDGYMYMKLCEGFAIPARFTPSGGVIRYGQSFALKPEWDSMYFTTQEEYSDDFIRRNTVADMGLSRKEITALGLLLCGGISLLGGIIWLIICLFK